MMGAATESPGAGGAAAGAGDVKASGLTFPVSAETDSNATGSSPATRGVAIAGRGSPPLREALELACTGLRTGARHDAL